MRRNHPSSNTVPPEASTQSPSVPIGSGASSQSEDTQPKISKPGYWKQSIGDILQSPGGTDAKRIKCSTQVPGASEIGVSRDGAIHALMMLEAENKARIMMSRQAQEDSFLN